MKAVYFDEHGGSEVLKYGDCRIQQPAMARLLLTSMQQA